MTEYHAVDDHGNKHRTFETHREALAYTSGTDLQALSDYAWADLHGS